MPAYRAGTVTKLQDGTVESATELPADVWEKVDKEPGMRDNTQDGEKMETEPKTKKSRKAQED